MTARSFVLCCVGVVAIAAATACGDPLQVKATLNTIEDTLAVYGLSEAPPSGPTALNTFVPSAVRTDPSQNYDVVFDIKPNASGQPTAYIYPPRAVGLFGSAGIIKDSTQSYDQITQAPVSGYNDSTAVPIKAGDVLVIQAASYACAAQLVTARRFIYSKLVIDSVNYTPFNATTNPAGSTIYFRMRVDPNCGFISFANGLPTF
jgi:hypothetical protein